MIKTPEFEEPLSFGASTDELPCDYENIRITEGAVVDLRYKGKTASVRVTKVIRPQAEFEGAIEAFEHEPEHADLKQGDVVQFGYDKIQHIHKWIESDQT